MKLKNINQYDKNFKINNAFSLSKNKYKKKIDNIKPRYMNDYYKNNTYKNKKKEKSFNDLLNNYYNNYKKIKNKYNFIEEESNYEKDEKKDNFNNVDHDEFEDKINNLYSLFITSVASDIDNITFDLTDKLINDMNDDNNDNLLKNTQTIDDYNLRLNQNIRPIKLSKNNDEKNILNVDGLNEKDSKFKKGNNLYTINDENNKSNIIESDNKENLANKDDNYLILKGNNNYDETPLLEDIMKYDYEIEYQPPYYEIPYSVLCERERENQKYISGSYCPYNTEELNNNEEQEINKRYYFNNSDINNEQEDVDVNIKYEGEDDNILKLINNQKIDKDHNLPMFENIIAYDYQQKYSPATYKIPFEIQKEIKNKEMKESSNYESDKGQNNGEAEIKSKNENIKDNENNNLPEVPPIEKKESKENDIEFSEEIGAFQPITIVKDDNEKKNNKEDNLINSKNIDNYSIPKAPSSNYYKEENINEKQKNEIKEKSINYDNSNGNDYRDIGENIKNEENINNGDNGKQIQEENTKQLNKNINDNEDNFDSIVVDELNDIDDNEDDDDYGGFD